MRRSRDGVLREQRIRRGELTAVGHRVVHGRPKYSEPQRITTEMVEDIHQLEPCDPEHLPEEILLTEVFHRRFPDLPSGVFRHSLSPRYATRSTAVADSAPV
jgi:acetate kinase